jgi:hypothetical protein
VERAAGRRRGTCRAPWASAGTMNIRTQHSASFATFMTNEAESETQKSTRWFGTSATWREGGKYDLAD